MRPERFPVDAVTRYASRFSMGQHEGVDLFADAGSPVVAVAAGKVRKATEKRGGNVVYLVESDGTQYYYSHLEGWEGEFPRSVRPGEVLGRVGNTGNARGAPPHVHFEVRPQGGAKVDPVPLLESLNPAPLVREPHPPASSPVVRPSPMGWLLLAGLFFLNRKKGWL